MSQSDTLDAAYILFASGRCGSTFFASLLASYGLAYPVEIRTAAKTKALLLSNRVHLWQRHDRRIWSVKLKPYNLTMPDKLVVKTRDVCFPIDLSPEGDIVGVKYIYIERLDKIQNGVARYYANTMGGLRHIYEESERQDISCIYDFDKIHEAVQGEVRRHERFLSYFRKLGIVPFPVFYEELLESPMEVLEQVSEYLQIPLLSEEDKAVQIPLRTENYITDSLVLQYKADCVSRGIIP